MAVDDSRKQASLTHFHVSGTLHRHLARSVRIGTWSLSNFDRRRAKNAHI